MFALVDGNVSEMRMRIPREIFLLLWDWFDQTTDSWEEIAARTNFGSSSTEGCAIHSTYSTLKNAFHSYLHWIVQRKWKQLRKVWFLLVSFLSFDWGYRNLITSQFREVILTDNSRIHENIQIRAGLESPKYWKLRNYLTWMLEGGREGDGCEQLDKVSTVCPFSCRLIFYWPRIKCAQCWRIFNKNGKNGKNLYQKSESKGLSVMKF